MSYDTSWYVIITNGEMINISTIKKFSFILEIYFKNLYSFKSFSKKKIENKTLLK